MHYSLPDLPLAQRRNTRPLIRLAADDTVNPGVVLCTLFGLYMHPSINRQSYHVYKPAEIEYAPHSVKVEIIWKVVQ